MWHGLQISYIFYNAMHVGDDNSSILGTECPLRNETDDDTKPVT